MNHKKAIAGVIISINSAFLGFITAQSLQLWLSGAASCVAIVSGVLAGRYYYRAAKKIES